MNIAVRHCAAGAAAWFFHASLCTRLAGSIVTPFSPDARLHLQNMCFPEDVMVIAGCSGFSATDPLQVYCRYGCRRVNTGSRWQDRRCRSLHCEMNPHRRVVGAFLSTISASKGGQMYHTDVFSLSGCRSVLYSHPKAILSGRGIIGGRHGRQDYPVILSMEI